MHAPAETAGRREWLGLAVLALPCLVYAMDLTVLNLALPALSADLRPSATELLWIVDIYGFLVAGALITMGSLGDRIGSRRLLMIGAVLFAGASVLAAFSTSAGMLIASRALLGLAGATIAPSTLALIRGLFADPRQRTVAIGLWVTSYSVGAAIGPLAGGALLELFWWGSVLLLGVPVSSWRSTCSRCSSSPRSRPGCGACPGALGFIAGATLGPRLLGRWSAAGLTASGLAVAALGYLLTGFAADSLLPIVVGSTVGAIGGGIVVTLVTDVIVGEAPPERAGAASATSETSAELGGALGIAVLGAIGAAVFRSGVAGGLPGGAPDAAGETIGGALAAGERLPAPAAEQLAFAARDAFEQALTVTASVGAAVLLATSVAVTVVLRGRRRTASPEVAAYAG